EQMLPVERFKPLAKVVNIAEHSNELAHRDLRMVQAASWRIQPPYVGPVVVSSPSRLSRTQVTYSAQHARVGYAQGCPTAVVSSYHCGHACHTAPMMPR